MTRTIITHNGPFHADEVMAIFLFRKYIPEYENAEIVRTRESTIISNRDSSTPVIDVGGRDDSEKLEFDHHHFKKGESPRYGKASASLVLEYVQGLGVEVPESIIKAVAEIDKCDIGDGNGRKDVSEIISSYNATWNEKTDENTSFAVALETLERCCHISEKTNKPLDEVLKNDTGVKGRLAFCKACKKEGEEIFLRQIKEQEQSFPGLVKIDNPALPFRELFSKERQDADPELAKMLRNVVYIQFPTSAGEIGVVAINTPEDPMQPKFRFPKEWGGLRGQELLKKIQETESSNPEYPLLKLPKIEIKLHAEKNENSYFCHSAGFYLAAGDENFALQAVKVSSFKHLFKGDFRDVMIPFLKQMLQKDSKDLNSMQKPSVAYRKPEASQRENQK